MNTKICLKSDGTIERGRKIIKYLESLGGENRDEWEGNNTISCYYYIGYNNNITFNNVIPEGYKLIDLPEEKTFPREMLVSMNNQYFAKQKVIAFFSNYINPWVTENDDKISLSLWKYAKELPEEPEIVEMTMEEVCKTLGKNIKIVK